MTGPAGFSREAIIGYLAALGAVTFWGGNFLIASVLADDVPPLALTFWRWTIALLLIVWLLPELWKHRSSFLQHKMFFLSASVTGIGFFHYAIYAASQTLGVLSLALIAATSGLFVLLLSPLLRREVLPLQIVGAVISLVGLAVLIGQGDPRLWLVDNLQIGNLWMISASLSWAVFSLIMEKPPQLNRIHIHVACVAIAVPLLIVPYAAEYSFTGGFDLDTTIALCLLYLAVLPSLACYVMWLKAVSILGAVRVHAIYYSLPAITALEAFVFLGASVHWFHLVAGILIIGGAILGLRRRAPVLA